MQTMFFKRPTALFKRLATFWLSVLFLTVAILQIGCTGKGEASEADSKSNVEKPADGPANTSDKSDKKDKTDPETDGKDKRDERVPVEVAPLGRGPIEAVLRYSTNLEAEESIEVFSQAARRVTELHVEEGDRVKAGDLLLRLQDDEQRLQVARIESQLAKERREYNRQKNLFEQKLIAEQVFNESTYQLEQLELSYQDATRELSYTEVRAPISGTITERKVNLGDTITVNQHLFNLVDFRSIVARIFVPEKVLPRLETGQEARILTNSLGGETRRGEVIRIAPIVDPRSGTVKVTVGMREYQGLLPGMYVEVDLVTETRPDALLVPKRAALYDQDQIFVFRLKDDKTVERLRLIPRLEDEQFIEPAPETGLEEGDRIVIAGQTGLKNGIEVRVVGEPAS